MLLRNAPNFLRSKYTLYSIVLTSAMFFGPDVEANSHSTQKVSWNSLSTVPNANRLLATESDTELKDVTQDVTQDLAPQGNAQRNGSAQAPANNFDAAQAGPSQQQGQGKGNAAVGPVINFNNVNITELLRFVSRLTGKNFIFDPQQLQFPVTIISETPATLEDVMAALLQNLRIHSFYLIEEGNSFIIHQSQDFRAPASLLRVDENGNQAPELATAVFQIGNIAPGRVASIIRTMTSKDAIVEVIDETMRVVVTDILANINKISDIIKKLDAPNSGLEIGQYVALNNSPSALINVALRILTPLAADKPLVLVPYQASNSVFIVSTPFLVEKTLSVLQSLDLNQSTFGLLNVDQMKFDASTAKKLQAEQFAENQRERERPIPPTREEVEAFTDRERNALLLGKGFTAEQITRLSPEQVISILREKGISQLEREKFLGQKRGVFATELPLGEAEATQFFIHKLQYRKAEDVTKALQAIATSLGGGSLGATSKTVIPPSDLVVTLNSVQPILENNALVFTGTKATLQRAKELINQIDVPVRQCFIETLILDTTLQNSLNFGVEWAGKYQMKNYAYSAGLLNGAGSSGASAIGQALQGVQLPNPVPTVPATTLQPVNLSEGLTGTAIGRKIRHNGTAFRAFAAFVNFLSTDNNTEVMVNPKIVTEHNVAAEIFAGAQVPIKGQSIVNSTANNTTNTVSTNYETQKVGIDLKVTPLISSGDMVTLIIDQSLSNTDSAQVASQGQNNAPPATINQTRVTTRVHVPSDYFLMMSGVLQTQKNEKISSVPLLGEIPIIGYFFNNKFLQNNKRTIIMYLRPKIIDTPIDIEQITRNEQKIYEELTERDTGWRKSLNEFKELLNF